MTKNNLSVFPGRGCIYFRGGHCLYEEILNPGFNSSWRCRIISRLEIEYDSFLRQAESFRLEDETAHRIWEKRLVRYLDEATLCVSFEPGEESELPGCVHARGDVCVLALPPCSGACQRFRARGTESSSGHQ